MWAITGRSRTVIPPASHARERDLTHRSGRPIAATRAARSPAVRRGIPVRGPTRPSLDRMSTYIAVFAMVMAYIALVAAYGALRTLARVRRATTVLGRG